MKWRHGLLRPPASGSRIRLTALFPVFPSICQPAGLHDRPWAVAESFTTIAADATIEEVSSTAAKLSTSNDGKVVAMGRSRPAATKASGNMADGHRGPRKAGATSHDGYFDDAIARLHDGRRDRVSCAVELCRVDAPQRSLKD